MEFITTGPIANALAPRLEVRQEALNDALQARDGARVVKIIKRVSGSSAAAARERARTRGTAPRTAEVNKHDRQHRGLVFTNTHNLKTPRGTVPTRSIVHRTHAFVQTLYELIVIFSWKNYYYCSRETAVVHKRSNQSPGGIPVIKDQSSNRAYEFLSTQNLMFTFRHGSRRCRMLRGFEPVQIFLQTFRHNIYSTIPTLYMCKCHHDCTYIQPEYGE